MKSCHPIENQANEFIDSHELERRVAALLDQNRKLFLLYQVTVV